jgi:hypothetical protein
MSSLWRLNHKKGDSVRQKKTHLTAPLDYVPVVGPFRFSLFFLLRVSHRYEMKINDGKLMIVHESF